MERICKPCLGECRVCNTGDPIKCQECNAFHYLDVAKEGCHVGNCPDGEGITDGSPGNEFICKPCFLNCRQCNTNNPAKCEHCIAGFYLGVFKAHCYNSNCPPMQGPLDPLNLFQCESCLPHCTKCSQVGKCDECESGKYISHPLRDACVDTCTDKSGINIDNASIAECVAC
jgi:proprotein convertase subtilisin/kexin type 5